MGIAHPCDQVSGSSRPRAPSMNDTADGRHAIDLVICNVDTPPAWLEDQIQALKSNNNWQGCQNTAASATKWPCGTNACPGLAKLNNVQAGRSVVSPATTGSRLRFAPEPSP